MTSDPTLGECYVYITPPGEVTPVTAGRFVLTADRRGEPVGRFVYGRSYLARENKVDIDPIELRLSDRTYQTARLKGVFGALRDAGPDYWGRRIIERHAGKKLHSELDYLLHSADDRAGALGFGLNVDPPAPVRKFNRTIELEKLQKIAGAIIADEELPTDETHTQIEELLLLGTSMGGARPKAVVEDDDGLWLAKFNRDDDRWNSARVEHSLLRTEDSHRGRERWSYVLLAEELRRSSAEPKADAQELFRRMAFNALISNSDDHPRNHAVLARETDWRLSPAYDLTPTTPVSLERRDLAMAIGSQGRHATAENLISESPRFLLEKAEAETIVNQMEEQVRNTWYHTAKAQGVSEADCERINGAFAYPGFRLTPGPA